MAKKLKVMCMTWNVELELPDAGQLKKFFGSFQRSADPGPPDIIAIGIQEGGGSTKYRPLFEDVLKDYVLVTKAKFKGVTKWWQVFSQTAAQGLYVLVKKSTFNVDTKDEGQKALNAESETNSKTLLGEKGFVFSEVNYEGCRIGFVSTHAETNQDKREGDFATIGKILKSHFDEKDGGPFSAIFVMGDLNYRLARTHDEKKNKKGFEQEKADIWEKMATEKGRKDLRARDTFPKDKPPQIPGTGRMVWPEFSNQCLPTYKRLKSKEGKAYLAKLEGNPDGYDPAVLKALYELKASDKGATNWDFGWLDRIGYADGSSGGSLLDKKIKIEGEPELFGGNWLIGGDHVPVFLHVVLTIS